MEGKAYKANDCGRLRHRERLNGYLQRMSNNLTAVQDFHQSVQGTILTWYSPPITMYSPSPFMMLLGRRSL